MVITPKLAINYDQAGDQEVNLDKRAKLHARSLKCYLKTDDSHSTMVEANKIRQYARDGGVSLLKELAPNFLEAGRRQAKNYDNAKAYEHLSTYISYHPNERNKLADEFNRSGNKELAQMLNPALKVFDCKSMLTKAGKVDDVETSLSNYAQYASACTNMPASPNDCKTVLETAEATTNPLTKLRFYKAGVNIGCSLAQSTQAPIIAIVKQFAKTPDAQGRKDNENAANLGRSLLPTDVVEREVPEKKEYGPGKHWFILEAGEQTEHWIHFPSGVKTSSEMHASPESDYITLMQDGRTFSMEQDRNEDHQVFRLIAKSKSIIKMINRVN